MTAGAGDPPGDATETTEVRAAGGVVWRRDGTGRPEVLLVHRPRYDDWTLPKGKADPGEDDLACARREVLEETGLDCRTGRALGTVRYRDGRGRPKAVRYWEMEPVADHGFHPGAEVDEVRWLALDAARDRLTYDHDRATLDRFAAGL